MLALQKLTGAPGVAMADVALPPPPAAGEVIVTVAAAGICGSDLHIKDWTDGYDFLLPALPVTLGHEFAGTITTLGADVAPSALGKRVVVKPSVACGECGYCRKGDSDDCQRRKPIGLLQPGAFAKLVKVPYGQCIEIPDGLELELAALVEPLTISEHAVQDGEVGPGDRVVIFGPGTIGQGAAVLAGKAGAAEVVVVGYNDPERARILADLKVSQFIDLAEPGSEARLRQLAAEGFQVAIEASGANSALELGLQILETTGIMVAVGIHPRKVSFDINTVVRKRLQIRGSYRASHAIWQRCIDLLAAAPQDFAPMVTHRMPLAEAVEGFEMCSRKEASKILLLP